MSLVSPVARILLTVGLVVIVLATTTSAQNFGQPPDRRLRVDWELDSRAATPRIDGYVHNDTLWWVNRVRLKVEGVAASGRPVGETGSWVLGDIPPGDRAYFVARAIGGAETYRVTVASYEVVSRGGP
jgi:hypothetical protein